MNRLVALIMCAGTFGAEAQITYPYNPDEDGNGQITVGDLQGILSTYGNEFSPSEILVGGVTLTNVLTQLQNSIDSLSSLTGGGGSVLDMPLGTVLPIASESVPEGWMLCDGRELSIEDYQDLYVLIGTTYGAGDSAFWAQVFYPATTFNIPDLRGRTIIGSDDMGGAESGLLLNHAATLGSTGGEEAHQLTIPELPQHLIYSSFSERHDLRPFSGENAVVDIFTEPIGNDQPHNNMQPYIALNYMIKVQASEDVIAQLESRITEIEELISEQDTLIIDVSYSCVADYNNSVFIDVDSPVIKFIGESNQNECYYHFSPPNDNITEILVVNASETAVRGFVGGSYLSNYQWVTLKGINGQWYLPWDRD
jgi:microcystin-dependent protein